MGWCPDLHPVRTVGVRHVRPKFGLFCATTPCHNSDIVSAIARRYGGQHEGQVDAGRKGMRRLWRCIAEAFATIGRLSFAGNVSVFSWYAAALAVQQSGACGSDLISEILETHAFVFLAFGECVDTKTAPLR